MKLCSSHNVALLGAFTDDTVLAFQFELYTSVQKLIRIRTALGMQYLLSPKHT